jgi:hypothetical protein
VEQPRTKEAAEKDTDSGRAPYQAVAKRGQQAQQSNAELSQQFFKAAINQHQRQVKAGQQIIPEQSILHASDPFPWAEYQAV